MKMKLTDEQCEEYRNLNINSNDLFMAIYADGKKSGYNAALIDVMDETKNLIQKAKRK